MGSWGSGLLESDAAWDLLSGVASDVTADLIRAGRTGPGDDGTARMGAAVGVLLQINPLTLDEDMAPSVREALVARRDSWAALGAEAAQILEQIVAGEGNKLADRLGERSGQLAQALGLSRNHVRDAALFAHPAARAYVQEVAERCAKGLDRRMRRKGLLIDDAWHVSGYLGVLLLLEPWQIARSRVARWESGFQACWKNYRLAPGASLKPWAPIIAAMQAAFALVRARAVDG